jgi:predicted nuclease of predicted toxin-antitoxin system
MPWVPVNTESQIFDEIRSEVGFILDNDVDRQVVMGMLQGRLGLSVVELPHRLRDQADEAVLAEAKRSGRVLVTHDRGFLQRSRFKPSENPGVVVFPGGEGNAYEHRGLLGTVLIFVSGLGYLFAETVVDVTAEGRITIWNPDPENGTVAPLSMRVRWDVNYPMEIWRNDDEEDWGVAPSEAWDE